jgi:hypothetical protein
MKKDGRCSTRLLPDHGQLAVGRKVTARNYEAPTLQKRAVLSAITSEDTGKGISPIIGDGVT